MNTLEDVLKEAELVGLDQEHRHAVANRYRLAVREFNACTDLLAVIGYHKNQSPQEYFIQRDAHASSKARNYIERHKRTL
jgi:hypothetical protein